MNFLQHFLPGQPVEDSEHRSFGAQTAAYRTLENGAGLALGFDAEATTGKLKQFQPLPTRGSAFLRGTIPQGQHYDYQVDAMQTAAFVSYQQALGARWQLSLGLRLEHINYDYDNRMLDGRTDDSGTPCGFGGCRYSRPADRDDSFFDLSPKLGLRYALNDNNKLELRVQRGFRAPQATELYRLQNAQSVAELDSVELDSYELSLSGSGNSWSGSWNYGLSLYLMDKANEIITNSARENLNGNHTAHRGLEATLGIDLSPSLSLHGAFNLAKHSYENRRLSGGMDIKGNEVDSAPDMFGNMRLQWQPHNRLLAELEWVHMGEYYTNPENTAAYPGHDVLNLRANYHISDAFGLTLNLLNISDEKYAERADWTTFSGDRYFPGEPPRAHLALTWNWQ